MTLQARVTGPVVRPVLVGFFDFVNDPAFGWTGPGLFTPTGTGDPILDNNIFSSAEGAITISEIGESAGGARPIQLAFSAHDNDADIIRQIVRDRRVWQLRKAKLWLFFLMDNEISVHPEYVQLFSGVIAQATTSREPGQPATITLECDADLRRSGNAPARLLDHVRFNPADLFSSFLLKLATGQVATAGTPSAGGAAGSGGGGRSGGLGNGRRVRF